MRQITIDRLLKSGKWMIRTDTNGISHHGFQWEPKGQWTIAPDWNALPQCGGGLHGQNTLGHGYCEPGNRVVLCEIDKIVIVDNNKVKTNRAKIIAIGKEIPPIFFTDGSLYLRDCDLKGITLPPELRRRAIY